MPLKEKLIKREYEYTSEDGDSCKAVYSEFEGHKYILLGKQGQDDKECQTWDAEMLFDLVDQIRDQTQKSHVSLRGRPNLSKPLVVDHRNTDSATIQSSVEESMRRFDDNEPAVQSFSPSTEQELSEFRTGVKIPTEEVGETPSDLKVSGGANSPDWQQQIEERKTEKKPVVKTVSEGPKRVNTDDLI